MLHAALHHIGGLATLGSLALAMVSTQRLLFALLGLLRSGHAAESDQRRSGNA